jgi:flagellar biosynthesis anti-sigma factor FlgM
MKIEQSGVPTTPDRLTQAGAATKADGVGRPTGGTGSPAGDSATISGDAHLVAEATRHIGDIDVVRPDVVERAKAALARGEVGSDLDRLATRLIDGLLADDTSGVDQ